MAQEKTAPRGRDLSGLVLSVKVGDGPTQARFRVADPALLRQFLVKALVQSRGDQQ
jgi:hypothetical protein